MADDKNKGFFKKSPQQADISVNAEQDTIGKLSDELLGIAGQDGADILPITDAQPNAEVDVQPDDTHQLASDGAGFASFAQAQPLIQLRNPAGNQLADNVPTTASNIASEYASAPPLASTRSKPVTRNNKQSDKQRLKKRQSRGKTGKNSKQQYYDQMAIGKLLTYMVLLVLLVPALLYLGVQFVNLPYDGRIIAMPNITSQRATQAGIVAEQSIKIGQRVNQNAPILSLYPSEFRTIDNRAASQLAKVRLQLSRLETQKLGQLTWGLPDDLRARAFQDDNFTEFVVAQQKKFKEYYDALDDYGQEIYTQRQRLEDRIKDAQQAITDLRQENANINNRLQRVAGQERQILLREVTFIKGDILDTNALIATFTRELDELQPRLRRLIRTRAQSLTPEITALQERHQQLLNKLAISDSVVVRAQAGGQLVELAGQNVGDAVQAGDILYRVARADNQNMVLQMSAPVALQPYLDNGNEGRLLMKTRTGDNASHPLRLLKIESIAAEQIQVTYQISITNLFETFGRLPDEDDVLSLQIKDVPLQPRLRGLWQRAQERRRFAFNGTSIGYRLPFFNRDNYAAFQEEKNDMQGFQAWVMVQLTNISAKFIPAKDE